MMFMEFNKYYLEDSGNEELTKLTLFCIKEGIKLYDILEGNPVMIKRSLSDDVNEILAKLYKTGKIELDYNQSQRPVLTRHLYVNTNKSEEFDVNKFRVYWSYSSTGQSGKMGDLKLIEGQIQDYLKMHPTVTFEDICSAANRYITNCIETGRFIKDADNFVIDSDGKSLLSVWLEEKDNITSKML